MYYSVNNFNIGALFNVFTSSGPKMSMKFPKYYINDKSKFQFCTSQKQSLETFQSILMLSVN